MKNIVLTVVVAVSIFSFGVLIGRDFLQSPVDQSEETADNTCSVPASTNGNIMDVDTCDEYCRNQDSVLVEFRHNMQTNALECVCVVSE
jgi:hypothetical protein